MEHIPENIRVAAGFIQRHLQRTLEGIQPGEGLPIRSYHRWVNETIHQHDKTGIEPIWLTQGVFSQGINSLVLQLPIVLFNAGITQTIIPASAIHCRIQDNFLSIQVKDVGTFITDVENGRLCTFLQPAATAVPATAEFMKRPKLSHYHRTPMDIIINDPGFKNVPGTSGITNISFIDNNSF